MKCITCYQELCDRAICEYCDLNYDLNQCDKELNEQLQFKEDLEFKLARSNQKLHGCINDVINDTMSELNNLYGTLNSLKSQCAL